MCEAALISIDKDLVACIVPVMVSLGKLSKFCVSSDWDAKAGYCRMAAELSKIPFSESVGHPSVHVHFNYLKEAPSNNETNYTSDYCRLCGVCMYGARWSWFFFFELERVIRPGISLYEYTYIYAYIYLLMYLWMDWIPVCFLT